MQGRLRGEAISVDIETSCAHCDRQIHIRADSEGRWSIREPNAGSLVFEPEVDWPTFTKPNIIDDF